MSERSGWPNVVEVRADARHAWEQHQLSRTTNFERRLAMLMPLGLFIIATVFFALSAQHTIDIFTIIFPVIGAVAPVGIELGIVYSAFMIAEATFTKSRISSAIQFLRRLLLIIIVIANGAGSLIVVVKNAGLSQLSTQQIVAAFPTLPAIEQVALVLALLSALAIPAAAVVSGEGFFNQLANRRKERRSLDDQWKDVRTQVEFEALRDAAINQGITPGKAARWAAEIAQSGVRPAPLVSASQRIETNETTRNDVKQLNVTKKDQATALLRENPQWNSLSIDVLESQTGIDRSTWHRVKREISQNGNGRHED